MKNAKLKIKIGNFIGVFINSFEFICIDFNLTIIIFHLKSIIFYLIEYIYSEARLITSSAHWFKLFPDSSAASAARRCTSGLTRNIILPE